MNERFKDEFEKITQKLLQIEHVTRGEIMSAPSLEYKGEAFAFLQRKNIVLRLGKDFDGIPYDIPTWYYPDYNIPSRGNWVLIRYFYLEEEREAFVMLALERIKGSLTIFAKNSITP